MICHHVRTSSTASCSASATSSRNSAFSSSSSRLLMGRRPCQRSRGVGLTRLRAVRGVVVADRCRRIGAPVGRVTVLRTTVVGPVSPSGARDGAPMTGPRQGSVERVRDPSTRTSARRLGHHDVLAGGDHAEELVADAGTQPAEASRQDEQHDQHADAAGERLPRTGQEPLGPLEVEGAQRGAREGW